MVVLAVRLNLNYCYLLHLSLHILYIVYILNHINMRGDLGQVRPIRGRLNAKKKNSWYCQQHSTNVRTWVCTTHLSTIRSKKNYSNDFMILHDNHDITIILQYNILLHDPICMLCPLGELPWTLSRLLHLLRRAGQPDNPRVKVLSFCCASNCCKTLHNATSTHTA